MPVWVRDAKEGTARKTTELKASPKPVLDLYEVRESILEQIRNKEALPLRKVRSRIGEKNDRVADKSSSRNTSATCDPIGSGCLNRNRISEVPITLSRRSSSGRLNVHERRSIVGDASAGDIDGCDQTSEATSAFPLPSPPLPPPPPPEFIENVFKCPSKAPIDRAHLTSVAATVTTASVNQGLRAGLYHSAGSFRNTLRIQKTSARGFKEVSFCSMRHLRDSAGNQPSAELFPGCSPALCGDEKECSSKAAPPLIAYRREKPDILGRGVAARLYDGRSEKPMTTRKSLDPNSPLRVLDSAYPSSGLTSSVAASSSETGHAEDFPASRTRVCIQPEVRQLPTTEASQSRKSNALGVQCCDHQYDVVQKSHHSPLVYKFRRYGHVTTSELAEEHEAKHLQKKEALVNKDRFPEGNCPTVKSVGTECSETKVDDGIKREENCRVGEVVPRRPLNRVYSKPNEVNKTPATAMSLSLAAEVEEDHLQGGPMLGRYTSTLLEGVSRAQDDTTVAAEYRPRQPLIYFSLPRQKRLPLGQKDRGAAVGQHGLSEHKPPRIRYCISSNADRFTDFASQSSPTRSKEDSGIQTGPEDGGLNTCNQPVSSGSTVWRPRSAILPSFHSSSVGTEAQTATTETTFLGTDCLKSGWTFPRHSIYEEQSVRQTEAPAERLSDSPLVAGRPACPPHHYTGLGMFQGLTPKLTRSSGRRPSSWQNRVDERLLGDAHTGKVCPYSPNYSCPLESTPGYATPSPVSLGAIITRSRNRSECHRPLRSSPALRPHRLEVPSLPGQYRDFWVGKTHPHQAAAPPTRREHQEASDSEVQETQRSVITQTCGLTQEHHHTQHSHPTWLRPEPLGGSGLEPRPFGASFDESDSPPLRRYLQRNGSLRLRPSHAADRPLLPNMSYAERFAHPSGPSLFVD
ncbi:hypothetical protein SprV_0301105700 [Sparganum proliferum]